MSHICSGPALHLKVTEGKDEIALYTKGCQSDCQTALNFVFALTIVHSEFLSVSLFFPALAYQWIPSTNLLFIVPRSSISVCACFLSFSLFSAVVVVTISQCCQGHWSLTYSKAWDWIQQFYYFFGLRFVYEFRHIGLPANKFAWHFFPFHSIRQIILLMLYGLSLLRICRNTF